MSSAAATPCSKYFCQMACRVLVFLLCRATDNQAVSVARMAANATHGALMLRVDFLSVQQCDSAPDVFGVNEMALPGTQRGMKRLSTHACPSMGVARRRAQRGGGRLDESDISHGLASGGLSLPVAQAIGQHVMLSFGVQVLSMP